MELFKLFGSVFVDTDAADKSIKKTSDNANNFGNTLGKGIATAAKWSAAIVAGAAAAVSGMVAVASKAAEQADEIDKASIRMGISAEAYQEYAYAAELAGVSTTQLEQAAKHLEGTDINFDDAMNSIMALGTEEERTAAAIDLFGEKVAYNLSPILQQSAEDFEATKQEAEALGLVLSGEDVKAGAELNDQLTKLQESFSAIVTKLGVALMPTVEKLVNWLLDYMPQIQAIFDKLAPVLLDLLDAVIPPLMDLIDELLPMLIDVINDLLPPVVDLIEGVLPVAIDLIKLLLPPVMQIVDAVLPVLVQLINTLLPILTPIFSLLQPIFDILLLLLTPLLDLINLILPPLAELIKIVAEVVNSVLTPILEKLQEWIKTFVDWLYDKVGDKVKKFFSNITDKFKEAWTYLKNNASTIQSNIKTWMENAKNTVVDKFTEIKDKITGIFDKVKETVSGAIEKVKSLFNFEWSLPQLKVPHFNISGGEAPWGFGGAGSLPSVGIEWYAKAMDNGLILDSPTIFGYGNGNLLGAGEAGPEVVAGASSLSAMISDAVGNNEVNIQILSELKKLNGGLYDTLVSALGTMGVKFDERELARLVRKYA